MHPSTIIFVTAPSLLKSWWGPSHGGTHVKRWPTTGVDGGGGSDSIIDHASSQITDFVSPLFASPAGKLKSSKLEVFMSLPGRRDRILSKTGIDIGSPREVILDHRALHVRKDHPSTTLQDWSLLPRVANEFDEAYAGWLSGDPKTQRLILVKRGSPRHFVYVAEVATGKSKGAREMLHTYFKTTDAGVAEFLANNTRKRSTVTVSLPGTSPGPALASRDSASPSDPTIPTQFKKSSVVLVVIRKKTMNKFDLLKSHIEAYTRKDGSVVQAHDDSRQAAQPKEQYAHDWHAGVAHEISRKGDASMPGGGKAVRAVAHPITHMGGYATRNTGNFRVKHEHNSGNGHNATAEMHHQVLSDHGFTESSHRADAGKTITGYDHPDGHTATVVHNRKERTVTTDIRQA